MAQPITSEERPDKPRRTRKIRGPEVRGQLIALSVATGSVNQAAHQLGIPQQTANLWVQQADSGDLRNFAAAKALEGAAIIFAGLPELLELAHARLKAALEQTDGNGTQAQASITALAVHIDKAFRLMSGSTSSGRYGSDSSPLEPNTRVLPAFEDPQP